VRGRICDVEAGPVHITTRGWEGVVGVPQEGGGIGGVAGGGREELVAGNSCKGRCRGDEPDLFEWSAYSSHVVLEDITQLRWPWKSAVACSMT
jgi:hypothetical protein